MKTIALFVASLGCAAFLSAAEKGWIEMFDGKTLNGWKANERSESLTVQDGAIVGDGEASHLFWMVANARTASSKPTSRSATVAIRVCTSARPSGRDSPRAMRRR